MSPGLHVAAIPGLAKECATLDMMQLLTSQGGCRTGMAKVINAYDLPARRVIHTVGPKNYSHLETYLDPAFMSIIKDPDQRRKEQWERIARAQNGFNFAKMLGFGDFGVISSSLLSLATLRDVLTSEKHSSELKDALKARSTAISHDEKLISSHKCFMEFLKSPSSSIRLAIYSVIRSYIKNIPHVINEANIKTIALSILSAFQEKDPNCHSSMWEASLKKDN
ncbi:hypothetical protein L2E82_27498 [Cichorium intybus]|uniref:Uncharacterized protein n=1 Tax=Cichorium intybus TaxID=13427 RepID=A0ACB9CT73_CICIN|nr:hypothetical protein L2E82_27498 [Cichorium intybus]